MAVLTKEVRARSAHIRVDRSFGLLFLARVLLLVLVAAVWQLAPERILPSYAVSRPRQVGSHLWDLVKDDVLLPAVVSTALAVFYALVVGACIGVLLAVVSSTRVGGWILQPIITVAYAVPKVALIPVLVIVMGIETRTHVTLVVSMVLFTYFFSMRQAFDEQDADQVLALRLMGAGRLAVVRLLTVRTAIPHLIGATRVALPLAFGIEVFAELRVPTAHGLGVLLANAANNLDAAGAIAVALVIVLIAYLLDTFVGGRLRRYTESIGMGMR